MTPRIEFTPPVDARDVDVAEGLIKAVGLISVMLNPPLLEAMGQMRVILPREMYFKLSTTHARDGMSELVLLRDYFGPRVIICGASE